MSLNELTQNLPQYPMEELSRIRQGLVKANRKVYDFGTGDPKIPTWQAIQEAARANITSISQYPITKGGPDLIEAMWGYLDRNFSLKPGGGLDIVATNGSKEAIFHIALCLVGRAGGKKIIAYPDPGYPVYRSSVQYAGGIPYPVRLQEKHQYLLQPWDLPQDIQKNMAALWVNYPHNPTGATADLAYFTKLVKWCEDFDVTLLADDCYLDIYNPLWENSEKRPLTPLTLTHKNIYSFMSLSKRSGMTGYRSGFLIGDARYMPAISKARANMGVGTPTMLQKAAVVAWGDDKHVAERRRIFHQRIEIAYASLHALGLIDQKPEASFYLWCRTPKAVDDLKFCLGLAEKGVITSPSQWLSEGIKGYFRLALVPDEKDTEEAMEIIRDFIKTI